MDKKILAVSEDGTIEYLQLTTKYLNDACEVAGKTLFINGNVCRATGVDKDPEAVNELINLPRTAAKDGITVIAIDKNSDKVVGVSFNKFLTNSESFFENFKKTLKNPKSRQIIDFIIHTDNICNLFDHCQVDTLMEILFLGTLPEYRKKGIAKKLCEISVDIAQQLVNGVNVKEPIDGNELSLEPVPQIVSAIFTSFISQRIGRQLGFDIAAEQSNKRLEFNGKVFENPNADTSKITVEYRRLYKTN